MANQIDENIKIKLIDYFVRRIEDFKVLNEKRTFKFKTRDIADEIDEFTQSVSRELRQLKKMGILNYEVSNRLTGEHKFLAPTNVKFTAASVLHFFSEQSVLLRKRKKSNAYQVKQILNETDRRIYQTHSHLKENFR